MICRLDKHIHVSFHMKGYKMVMWVLIAIYDDLRRHLSLIFSNVFMTPPLAGQGEIPKNRLNLVP